MLRKSTLVLFCLVTASPLAAEVHRCAEVWTNLPCEPQASMLPSDDIKVEGPLGEKKSIAESLNRFAAKVEAETGHIDFEAQGVLPFCLRQEVSIEECRARALRADKALVSSLQSSIRLAQRQSELIQKRHELEFRRERQLREVERARLSRKRRL